MMAEDEVELEEVDSSYPSKGTQAFGKKMEAIDEPLEDGGASILNKVGKQCHLLAIFVAKLAFAKRSVEKEEISWLQQADNSQTTPPMPNTRTLMEYS